MLQGTISGRDKEGAEYYFDTGMFFDTPVYLGELRTDKDGRLIFLGGRGVSTGYKGAKLIRPPGRRALSRAARSAGNRRGSYPLRLMAGGVQGQSCAA
jgi:hypothetical protein